MIEHDFDTVTASITEFVDFCERMELIEQTEQGQMSQAVTKSNDGHKNVKPAARRRKGQWNDDNFCLVHNKTGPKGHTTAECKGVEAQAAKLQADYIKCSDAKRRKTGKHSEEVNMIKDVFPEQFGYSEKEIADKKRGVQKRKQKAALEKELQHMEALSPVISQRVTEGQARRTMVHLML